MNEFEFGFICSAHENFEQIAYDFYESLDGIIASRDGQIFATVEVETDDPVKSALVAVQRLEELGLRVVRVDNDLVDASEIAARLGRSRQNVQQWATGQRQAGFPAPIASISGKRIWEWTDIVEWSISAKLSALPRTLSHADAVSVDHAIIRSHEAASKQVDLTWVHSIQAAVLQGGGQKLPATYKDFRQSDVIRVA